MPVSFRVRTEPLAPVAAAARGPAATALARRLLARDDAALARLSGVGGPSLLVLSGDRDDLPWIDGIVYLGRDPAAPALRLPTTLAPDVPPALLERAVLARLQGAAPPIVVLVDPPALVPFGEARPVDRDTLRRWVEGA